MRILGKTIDMTNPEWVCKISDMIAEAKDAEFINDLSMIAHALVTELATEQDKSVITSDTNRYKILSSDLIGQKVKKVCLLQPELSGFDDPVTGIVFESGDIVYPSKDDEGNGKGTFFAILDTQPVRIFANE